MKNASNLNGQPENRTSVRNCCSQCNSEKKYFKCFEECFKGVIKSNRTQKDQLNNKQQILSNGSSRSEGNVWTINKTERYPKLKSISSDNIQNNIENFKKLRSKTSDNIKNTNISSSENFKGKRNSKKLEY